MRFWRMCTSRQVRKLIGANPSDDKRAARLNCISHLLSQFDYGDVTPPEVQIPTMAKVDYIRPPMHEQTFVPLNF